MKASSPMRPNLPLVVTVLFWGFNFVSLKLIRPDELSAGAVYGLRFALQWIALAALCAAMRLPLRAPREHRARIALVGFLTMGLYMALFIAGATRTRPTDSAVILATMPVMTWLAAIVAGQETFAIGRLLASFVAFGGVALVILGGGAQAGGDLLGDSLVAFGGVFWSVGVVIARPVLADVPALSFFTMTMPGALPVVLVVAGPALVRVDWARVSAVSWANLAQLVLGSGVLATACYYRGINDLGAAGATLYQYFVPVIAAGFAWSLLGQPLRPVQGLGFAILLIALAWPHRRLLLARREPDRTPRA